MDNQKDFGLWAHFGIASGLCQNSDATSFW